MKILKFNAIWCSGCIVMKKIMKVLLLMELKKKNRLSLGPGEYFEILPFYIEKDNLIKGKIVST